MGDEMKISVGMTKRQAIRAARKNGANSEAIGKIKAFFKADKDKSVSNPVEAALLNSFATGEELKIPRNKEKELFTPVMIENNSYTKHYTNDDGTFINITGDKKGNTISSSYGYRDGGKFTSLADTDGDGIADFYESSDTQDGTTSYFIDKNLDGVPDHNGSFNLPIPETRTDARADVVALDSLDNKSKFLEKFNNFLKKTAPKDAELKFEQDEHLGIGIENGAPMDPLDPMPNPKDKNIDHFDITF